VPRTNPCTPRTRSGRLAKAEQFLDAAQTIADLADDAQDVTDAFVTMCVHAGIAASDVLCCARLGVHAVGENHQEAVGLLRRVDAQLARDLATLLGLKTKSGYSAHPTGAEERLRVDRAANRLVQAARAV
jgi:dihydropteroate synthase